MRICFKQRSDHFTFTCYVLLLNGRCIVFKLHAHLVSRGPVDPSLWRYKSDSLTHAKRERVIKREREKERWTLNMHARHSVNIAKIVRVNNDQKLQTIRLNTQYLHHILCYHFLMRDRAHSDFEHRLQDTIWAVISFDWRW